MIAERQKLYDSISCKLYSLTKEIEASKYNNLDEAVRDLSNDKRYPYRMICSTFMDDEEIKRILSINSNSSSDDSHLGYDAHISQKLIDILIREFYKLNLGTETPSIEQAQAYFRNINITDNDEVNTFVINWFFTQFLIQQTAFEGILHNLNLVGIMPKEKSFSCIVECVTTLINQYTTLQQLQQMQNNNQYNVVGDANNVVMQKDHEIFLLQKRLENEESDNNANKQKLSDIQKCINGSGSDTEKLDAILGLLQS